jgi:hypothetical protein
MLDQETIETSDCQKLDPANKFKYRNTESEMTADQAMRFQNYLMRHDLWTKFLTEDALGQR